MSLPNPGMTFTPFDILPASDLNDIVENIEALALGTGLDDGVITSAKLASSILTVSKESNPYKFSVYRNAALTSTNADARVNFDTEVFDTNNNFDVTTNVGRYTVPVTGFYGFIANVGNTLATASLMRTSIAVNGAVTKIGASATPDTTANLFPVVALLSLTAGDYVEAFFVGGNGSVIGVGAIQCYFMGIMLART